MAGGKKGGGKKGGNRRTQRSARFNKIAANNIALQDQPQADLYGMMQQQTQADQLRQLQTADSVYGGAYDRIKDVAAPDFGGIADRLNQSIQGLAPSFAGAEYQAPGEAGAGQNLGLAHGAAGNTMLSNLEARNAIAQGSAQRQAALGGQYAGDRVIQDMKDSLEQYRNQLANLHANDPYQIQQEATRLEDQAMSRRLAQSQIQGDKAFSQYLQNMLGNQLGGGGGGGGGGGRPRPGGNPVGPGGGTGGYGLGDTAAGGNRGTGSVSGSGTVGATQGGGNYPTAGSGAIPQSWTNADVWNELPPSVTHAYTRPYGVTLRGSYNQTPHPSFTNFRDFQAAYKAFLDQINQLYNARGGPGYDITRPGL